MFNLENSVEFYYVVLQRFVYVFIKDTFSENDDAVHVETKNQTSQVKKIIFFTNDMMLFVSTLKQ